MQRHSAAQQIEALEAGFDGGINDLHREILLDIAATGQYCHPWPPLSKLIEARLREVVTQFTEHDRAAAPPGQLPSHAAERAQAALAAVPVRLDDLTLMLHNNFPVQAPFTLQRLCEVLMRPRRVFSSTQKVLNAVERLLAVSSSLPPTPPEVWEEGRPSLAAPAYTTPDEPVGPATPPYPLYIDRVMPDVPPRLGEPAPRGYTIISTVASAARNGNGGVGGNGGGGVVASAATSMPLGLGLHADASANGSASPSVDSLLKDLDDLDDGRDDEEGEGATTRAHEEALPAVVGADEELDDEDGDDEEVHYGGGAGEGGARRGGAGGGLGAGATAAAAPAPAASTASELWQQIIADAPIAVSGAAPETSEGGLVEDDDTS